MKKVEYHQKKWRRREQKPAVILIFVNVNRPSGIYAMEVDRRAEDAIMDTPWELVK